MMDPEEREMLADQIGFHVGWYIQEQTKHLIEAMPCLCKGDPDGIRYECKRCKKLEELKNAN